jgi:hypothetical protein
MWPLFHLATSAAKCQGEAIASYSTNVRARKTHAHAQDNHEKTPCVWLRVGSGKPLYHVHTRQPGGD